MEKQNKGEKVEKIKGHAIVLIKNRIIDRIKEDEQDRRHQERLVYIQRRYGKMKGKKGFKPISGPYVVAADYRLKQIIHKCFKNLKEEEQDVLRMFYDEERTLGEITEKIKVKTSKSVYRIKHDALVKLGKVLKERLGPEIQDLKGRFHDISIWQQKFEEHPEMLEPGPIPEAFIQDNPELNEEAKKYMDMLLHSLHEVAKIMPISDMMDEYLYGRLEGKQKELFEKHLLECDDCYEDFKERETILSVLRPVLDDIK